MLYIIGVGLKPEHITLQALSAIKNCNNVFLDTYTSAFSQGTIAELEKLIEKKIFAAPRATLEDGAKEIFALAKSNNVAVLVVGNPLTATTHIQLLLDARAHKIKTEIIAGISVTNFLAKTGLDEYKFGRTCTIAEHKPNFEPDSFFDFIAQNSAMGLHTLCLLDTGDGKKFMSASDAIKILEKIEKQKKQSILLQKTFVVLAGAGSDKEQILVGDLEKIKNSKVSAFPQSLIVCGNLNEKEKEALGALHA